MCIRDSHLIDCTEDDIVDAWRTIRGEIEAYGGGLASKKEILALNKVDAIPEEFIGEKRAELEDASGQEVLALSGAAGTGVEDVLRRLRSMIEADRAASSADPAAESAVPWTP